MLKRRAHDAPRTAWATSAAPGPRRGAFFIRRMASPPRAVGAWSFEGLDRSLGKEPVQVRLAESEPPPETNVRDLSSLARHVQRGNTQPKKARRFHRVHDPV